MSTAFPLTFYIVFILLGRYLSTSTTYVSYLLNYYKLSSRYRSVKSPVRVLPIFTAYIYKDIGLESFTYIALFVSNSFSMLTELFFLPSS